MKFKTLLTALRSKGRLADAVCYEQAVTKKFAGVLSRVEIGELEVDEIASVLKLVKEFMAESKPTALASYVAELQARGFSVSVAEKYRKCLH